MKEDDNHNPDEHAPDGDAKNIPGIYNYCDRWCERCPFTSRCLNCKMVEEKFGDTDAYDLNNAAFWEKFQETLQDALDMLREIAEEEGIDLDSIAVDEEDRLKRERDKKAVIPIIAHMSKRYIEMVDNWFTSNDYLLPKDVNADDGESNFTTVKSDTHDGEIDWEDALEVIRWYQFQIHVKLSRAIDGKDDKRIPELEDFPKDSDGSAKVALIGVDRSIAAWREVMKFFEIDEDEIIRIISYLDRLRRSTEIEFPDARAFIRPGFDELDMGRQADIED